MTARSGAKLEGMGLSTWFLSKDQSNNQRILEGPDSNTNLTRSESGFIRS